MKLLSEGFQGKAEEMFQDRGFSFAQAELNDTTTLAALRSKAERAQPKPTEKNPLYAKFLKKEQPPMTPDQLADIEARREAAQRHQEVRAASLMVASLRIAELPCRRASEWQRRDDADTEH